MSPEAKMQAEQIAAVVVSQLQTANQEFVERTATVRVRTAAAIIVSIVTCTASIVFWGVKIYGKIDVASSDRWTASNMQRYATTGAERNPGIRVPNPADIVRGEDTIRSIYVDPTTKNVLLSQ